MTRVAVVMTTVGLPSEVWGLRQLAAFDRLETRLFAWRRSEDGPQPPASTPLTLFDAPFDPPRDPLRRVAGRLGLGWARTPSAAQRAAIREALLAARPDVVFCHFLWNAMQVVPALDGAVPVVAQVHGRDVSTLLDIPDYRAAARRTLPRLAWVAAVGRHQIDKLRPLGLGPSGVIPCGAPFADFAAAPPPERREGEAMRFVAVGRLAPEKGVLETLEALALLRRTAPGAELVLIGEGELSAAARARADAPDLAGAVTFAGRQPPDAVAATLRRCHAFLQHSLPLNGAAEGFGVALTEAGAAGLPLIASDIGGIPDQLEHGLNGFLHPPGDVAAQAALMARLAQDEALRRRMGLAARAVAQRFDARLLAGRLQDALEAVARGETPAEAADQTNQNT